MVRLYVAKCAKDSEHETGKKLAEHAFFEVFKKHEPLSHAESGKPCFKGSENTFISISHSDGLCLAALSDSEIGVDAERMTGDTLRLIKLAKRFFTPGEAEYVKEAPEKRFFEIWCKKESYMKYTGKGFSLPMNSFSVFELPIRYSHFIYGEHTICVCSTEEFSDKPILAVL